MRRIGLMWQIIAPVMVAFTVGALLLQAEFAARRRQHLTEQAIARFRNDVALTLLRVSDRHGQAASDIRRALLLGGDAEDPSRTLERITEGYWEQVQRDIDEVQRVFQSRPDFVKVPEFEEKRTLRQLDRIRSASAELSALLRQWRFLQEDDVETKSILLERFEEVSGTVDGQVRLLHNYILRIRLPSFEQEALYFRLGIVVLGITLLAILWRLLAVSAGLRRLATGEVIRPGSKEESQLGNHVHALVARANREESEHGRSQRELVTARQSARRGEHDLALFRTYHDTLVNNLRTGVVLLDRDGAIRSTNRATQELLRDGVPHGVPFLDTAFGAQLKRERPEITATWLNELQGPIRFEGVRVPVGSQQRLLDIRLIPTRDELGEYQGFIVGLDDITESMETKEQLLAAERLAAVGRVSARVAHEIRNPLSAIGLNAELLSEEIEKNRDPGEARQLLKGIGDEIERLTHITETYLELTRLPAPERRPIDVHALLHEMAVMLRPEFQRDGVEIRLDLAGDAQATVDPGQLRQALLNILRNAREAVGSSGEITVSTRHDASELTILVHDNGMGISDEAQKRIFEPFFTTKSKGTGLGLSITHEIVQSHGGHVEISSKSGEGTTLEISLPTT